jgi:hypothetical protein
MWRMRVYRWKCERYVGIERQEHVSLLLSYQSLLSITPIKDCACCQHANSRDDADDEFSLVAMHDLASLIRDYASGIKPSADGIEAVLGRCSGSWKLYLHFLLLVSQHTAVVPCQHLLSDHCIMLSCLLNNSHISY